MYYTTAIIILLYYIIENFQTFKSNLELDLEIQKEFNLEVKEEC